MDKSEQMQMNGKRHEQPCHAEKGILGNTKLRGQLIWHSPENKKNKQPILDNDQTKNME